MKKNYFFYVLILMLAGSVGSMVAQRKYQDLNRGVVAVNDGNAASSPVFISWRYLIEDPENVSYNLYCNPGGTGSYVKLNQQAPLHASNFTTTLAQVPDQSLLAVRTVVDGVEGPLSTPFLFRTRSHRSIFIEINYDGFLPNADYSTKFIWPADLDGDGTYDYVVDRRSNVGGSHKIEGYLSSGERLWTVDMGPNVDISAGHNDMVIAYDMTNDGKSEVVIKSSDGTRFWNKESNAWGAYLLNATNGDTDGDGIIDYASSATRVPPQYITVLNGMTGAEMNTLEMSYPNDSYLQYTRDSKQLFMDADYANLNGHMGIAYLDGINPSVVMEYMCRTKDGYHWYYASAWGYRFVQGLPIQWEEKYTWNRNRQNAAEFHHIRVGDVDFDGKDEMLEGGYTLNNDGSLLFSAGISHGDRFRVGDIDPDRPGLETFAIQQNAGDMLGMILYDASTGEAIKKWYLSSVGDVGRGECIDFDPNHKGYEMWSTMGNMYNAKGELIYKGSVQFPREGMWWDGELDREILSAPDGSGFNAMICKYSGDGFFGNRLIEFSKMMDWRVHTEYGARPAFFGDIIGDWREEIVLKRYAYLDGVEVNIGFVGFSTDYATEHRLYCLMQNPMYRMQTTTRGYYQSAYPDYYLGYEMSMPALPPMIKADYVWKSGSVWDLSAAAFTDYSASVSKPYANGASVMFDLSGDNRDTIRLSGDLNASTVYVMSPVGHDYVFGGNGRLTGETRFWKSQLGRATVLGDHTYTGKTIVDEGILEVQGSLQSPVEVRAKGTLAGNPVLNGGLTVLPGLNDEGGRLSPGDNRNAFGRLLVNGDLALQGGVRLEFDLQTLNGLRTDTLRVNGNLSFSGSNHVRVVSEETKPEPGRYALIVASGSVSGTADSLILSGLQSLSKELIWSNDTLYLAIYGQRAPQTGVRWNATTTGLWNYLDQNFELAAESVSFVNGDQVVFTDEAAVKDVTLTDFMETTGVLVDNSGATYTFASAEGGLSGTGGLIKRGSGTLRLLANQSNFTGAVSIEGGALEVTDLADAGQASCLGAAIGVDSDIRMQSAVLRVDHINTFTNRNVVLSDTCALDISQSNSNISFKGLISGSGRLVKTGIGQLNMTYSGANTYTGGTEVLGGSIAMGTWRSTFGQLGSPLMLTGNSTVRIFNNNSTSAVPVFDYQVSVPTGGTGTLRGGDRCSVRGTLSGGGTLHYYTPYVRCDMSGNWSAFEGRIHVSGQDFRMTTFNGMPKAVVHLEDGVTMGHWKPGSGTALTGGTTQLGGLSGVSGSYVYNGTYQIGYANKDAQYEGTFGAGVTFSKYGTAVWTLTGDNSAMTSTVSVFGGTLRVANATGSATGMGTVVVHSTATLDGSGVLFGGVQAETGSTLAGTLTIGGATTVKSGAQLRVGQEDDRTTSQMTFANHLNLLKGSSIQLKMFGGVLAKADQLRVLGTLNCGGTLILVKPTSTPIVPGATLQLFDAASIGAGRFDSIVYPEGTTPANWDTTRLYTEGILKAIQVSSIDGLSNERLFAIQNSLVDEVCTIHVSDALQSGRLVLMDMDGRVLMERSVEGGTSIQWALHTVKAGPYLIGLQSNQQTIYYKIIKQ